MDTVRESENHNRREFDREKEKTRRDHVSNSEENHIVDKKERQDDKLNAHEIRRSINEDLNEEE